MVVHAEHPEQSPFGAAESMLPDLQRARSLGVTELIWDLNIAFLPIDRQLAEFRTLARLIKQ